MTSLLKLWKYALALAGVFAIAVTLYLFAARAHYPFELEWMEGGSLVTVKRILDGQPLFVPPSIDFIPYIYTPFYFYLSAAAAKILGLSFLPLRLVSVASTLATYGLLYRLAFEETRKHWVGLLAAGLFAATFRVGGAWFDIARSDMLFFALFLAGYWLARRPGAGALVAAAVLLSLAYFTKQTIVVGLVGILTFMLLRRGWRRAAQLAVLLLALIGGGTLLGNLLTGGWYGYYTITVPAAHHVAVSIDSVKVALSSMRPVWPMLALSAVYLALCLLRRRYDAFWFFGLLLGSMLVLSWVAFINPGAYDNALIPGYAILSLTGALGLAALTEAAYRSPAAVLLPVTACLLLTVQFAMLRYPVPRQVPTAADEQAGRQLLDQLAQVNREVYIPSSSYLNIYLNKPTYAHVMAIWELEGLFGGMADARLRENIDRALNSGRFQALVMDNKYLLKHTIPPEYRWPIPLFNDAVFYPVTGSNNRPEWIYHRFAGEAEEITAADVPRRDLNAVFSGVLRLETVIVPTEAEPNTALPVEFFWNVLAPPPQDYTAFAHVLNQEGKLVAQFDRPPGGDASPTSSWQPGAYFRDRLEVSLPADLAPGRYRVVVGLYVRPELTRQPVVVNGGAPAESITVGEVTVGP